MARQCKVCNGGEGIHTFMEPECKAANDLAALSAYVMALREKSRALSWPFSWKTSLAARLIKLVVGDK
jgi:hypothetical protein